MEANLRGRPQSEKGLHRRSVDELLQHLLPFRVMAVRVGQTVVQRQTMLGIDHQVMGFVDVSHADGIDPDRGELPGLLAEEVAIDEIVDRWGDEECRAQRTARPGPRGVRPGRAGGLRSAAGPALKRPRPPAVSAKAAKRTSPAARAVRPAAPPRPGNSASGSLRPLRQPRRTWGKSDRAWTSIRRRPVLVVGSHQLRIDEDGLWSLLPEM